MSFNIHTKKDIIKKIGKGIARGAVRTAYYTGRARSAIGEAKEAYACVCRHSLTQSVIHTHAKKDTKIETQIR